MFFQRCCLYIRRISKIHPWEHQPVQVLSFLPWQPQLLLSLHPPGLQPFEQGSCVLLPIMSCPLCQLPEMNPCRLMCLQPALLLPGEALSPYMHLQFLLWCLLLPVLMLQQTHLIFPYFWQSRQQHELRSVHVPV